MNNTTHLTGLTGLADPYETYVMKLCQNAALHPEELVEILLELSCTNLLYRRARLLSSTGIYSRRTDWSHMELQTPGHYQRSLLNRAFVAGACAVDDLDPGTLARLIRRMISAGRTQDWSSTIPSTSQLNSLLEQIDRQTEHFAAYRNFRRQRRQRVHADK